MKNEGKSIVNCRDQLAESLSTVIEWVKFAEAKNAVLITMSGFSIWGCVRLITAANVHWAFQIYLIQLLTMLFLGLTVSLISLKPILRHGFLTPKKHEKVDENIFYFGYLATLSRSDLLKKYREHFNGEVTADDRVEKMYADQIIVNSRIAARKFGLFDFAASCAICGVLTLPVGMAVMKALKHSRSDKHDLG